jgi:hypothetical protein
MYVLFLTYKYKISLYDLLDLQLVSYGVKMNSRVCAMILLALSKD